nr:hypothetical protein CFP56_70807 [Quercus suber]
MVRLTSRFLVSGIPLGSYVNLLSHSRCWHSLPDKITDIWRHGSVELQASTTCRWRDQVLLLHDRSRKGVCVEDDEGTTATVVPAVEGIATSEPLSFSATPRSFIRQAHIQATPIRGAYMMKIVWIPVMYESMTASYCIGVSGRRFKV